MKNNSKNIKFIDLFAGLGGFHVALSRRGYQCVFASEIDDQLRSLYAANFGIYPSGDIRKIDLSTVPSHDLLCAGFPCQPFSKAGKQAGLNCPDHGDLFYYVLRMLRIHRPKFFILENVPNLLRHAGGTTFALMERRLRRLGYHVDAHVLSPHQFGVPQNRPRAYIVGSLNPLPAVDWRAAATEHPTSIDWVLDSIPKDSQRLSVYERKVLATWQDFIESFPSEQDLPGGFPIWAMEFGATYPYEDLTPFKVSNRTLGKYRGALGVSLAALAPDRRYLALPSYAQATADHFPEWKINFIRKNRELYKENKKWIDKWLPQIKGFSASHQKFEWHCKGESRSIWSHLIQFRPSGIRVKRRSAAPSLVAMTSTMVPVIGWQKRYLTPHECARLQNLESLKNLPQGPAAFKAFGNAVNAKVVEEVAKYLLESSGQTTACVKPRVIRNAAA